MHHKVINYEVPETIAGHAFKSGCLCDSCKTFMSIETNRYGDSEIAALQGCVDILGQVSITVRSRILRYLQDRFVE